MMGRFDIIMVDACCRPASALKQIESLWRKLMTVSEGCVIVVVGQDVMSRQFAINDREELEREVIEVRPATQAVHSKTATARTVPRASAARKPRSTCCVCRSERLRRV